MWPVGKRHSRLGRSIEADVVVVGGGMAGIAAAHHLKMDGRDVVLVEKDEIGGLATGASSGVLYYGSGTNYLPAVKLFGDETASRLWQETAEVIRQIEETAADAGLDCGLRTCGSVMVAKNDSEVADLEAEFSSLKRMGFPVRSLSGNEVKELFPLREFLGDLAFDAVGQIHPGQFASGVAEVDGLTIYEGTECTDWKEDTDGVVVRTPGGEIRCPEIVVATNYEACLGYENDFEIESSVILASERTTRVEEAFTTEKIFWTMEDRYDMFYPRDDRLIVELYALGDE